jgi:NAD(P)H-dependent FMN reductase
MLIVGLSGSLRARSSTALLLREAARATPTEARFELYEELATIPPFNPDLDEEGAIGPSSVAALRSRLAAAHGVVICSPEYAHGVPGSLKNALDWLVSTIELIGKPVVVIGTGEFAHAQLIETLTTMSWRVLPEASFRVPSTRTLFDANGYVRDEAIRNELARSMAALIACNTRD